jgi:hypothetical protein
MTSEFYQPRDVQLGPTDVLGAALLCLPFGDLTWRLRIDESGLVTQDICLYFDPLYPKQEVFTRTTQLTGEQLDELLTLADEIDFVSLNDEYEQGSVDDDRTTAIVLKTPEGVKHVYAYGAATAAHEGDADMQRYIRLWDAITEHAPMNTPAWKQERKELELESRIVALKRRVTEPDFQPPTVKEFLAAVFIVPIFIFIAQVFYPAFGRTLPELPTLVEFLSFTFLYYGIAMLCFVRRYFNRRRERLTAEQQLAQFHEDGLTDF